MSPNIDSLNLSSIKVNPKSTVMLSDIARNSSCLSLEDEVVVFQTTIGAGQPDVFPLYVDAMMLILVKEGTSRIGIDLIEYDVCKDSLIVLQPKNYIFLSTCSEHCEAHVIACSRQVIEEVIPKLTDVLPMLLLHRTVPVSQLTPSQAERLDSYYEFIASKLCQPSGMFLKQKIMRLLQAALYEMLDIQSESIGNTLCTHTRQEEIMAKFIIAVTENFRRERQVSYYADMLCITAKHLSAVVKKISGRSAGEWIDNYVVMEAKVLLKTTDLSIQEVSDKLNFKNQSFFGKFFKHLTGMTPTEYRKSNA